jgi:hypothetical protein
VRRSPTASNENSFSDKMSSSSGRCCAGIV